MSIPRDNDIVRGLGFVALYVAYLEGQIDNLLFMLQPISEFPENEQRWPTSRKIEKAKQILASLTFEYHDAMLHDLDKCKELLEWRNEVIHGRIYANFDRPDVLKVGRPGMDSIGRKWPKNALRHKWKSTLPSGRLRVFKKIQIGGPKNAAMVDAHFIVSLRMKIVIPPSATVKKI